MRWVVSRCKVFSYNVTCITVSQPLNVAAFVSSAC
jgi:hypothetical protein